MLIRQFSDIHLDNDSLNPHDPVPQLWQPDPLPEDADTVLMLVGDLWYDNKPFRRYNNTLSWIEMIAAKFKAVVVILGNHDYWHGSLNRAPDKAKESIKAFGLTNVHLLERDSVVIDEVKFVGCTLWTSFKNGDPHVMLVAGTAMNDYQYMTYGTGVIRRKARPMDVYKDYLKSLAWLKTSAVRDYPDQRLVVMTHMAPSYQSVHERHRQRSASTNYFYFSDLDYTVDEIGADLWAHGHTHDPCSYMIGATQVICNPRGYNGYEDTGYCTRMQMKLEAGKSLVLP